MPCEALLAQAIMLTGRCATGPLRPARRLLFARTFVLNRDAFARRHTIARVRLSIAAAYGSINLRAHLWTLRANAAAVGCATSALEFAVQSCAALPGNATRATGLSLGERGRCCRCRRCCLRTLSGLANRDPFARGLALVPVRLIVAAAHRAVLLGAHLWNRLAHA